MILPPREFITKAMADAKTTFDVFDAIVGRMEADAAKIAELEAKCAERTKEMIEWIEAGILSTAAERRIAELEKELAA